MEMFIREPETGYSPDYGLIIGTLVDYACSFYGVARPSIGQSYRRSTNMSIVERIMLEVHTVERGEKYVNGAWYLEWEELGRMITIGFIRLAME